MIDEFYRLSLQPSQSFIIPDKCYENMLFKSKIDANNNNNDY